MNFLKISIVITFSICLSGCFCSLLSGNNGYTITADKMYGSITANGIDVTEEIHSGEYRYYDKDNIVFEFTPNEDLDVEFSGWYYISGFFSQNEILITESNSIDTTDGFYGGMYPKISTPSIESITENPDRSGVIVKLNSKDGELYRYIRFKDGIIESITAVPIDSSAYIYGLKAGMIYYSLEKIFYSYSIESGSHEIILDYSDDDIFLRNYVDTGYILYTISDDYIVQSLNILDLDTENIKTYLPLAGTDLSDAILSEDGNVIIIEEDIGDDTRVSRVDISGGTSTVLIPAIEGSHDVSYGFHDIDKTGSTFCYGASYYEQTTECQVHEGSGIYIYSGDCHAIINRASYSEDGWFISIEDEGKTGFYSLNPDTMQCTSLFSLPFYRNNIENQDIFKAGLINFTFTTPDLEYYHYNSFSQYAFYNYADNSINIIPAKNIIDCTIGYLSGYLND